MRTASLDYELDPARIATRPAEPRDAARMLVVDRERDTIEHRRVHELPTFLRAGDSIVLNTTHVIPARVRFHRMPGETAFEGLLLGDGSSGELAAYVRGAKRLHAGDRLELRDHGGASVGAFEVLPREDERVRLRVLEGTSLEHALDAAGRAPLPPYILGARRDEGITEDADLDERDRSWYQTVFARLSDHASVAAPTAGLHFTPALLEAIAAAGVQRIDVDLEVGAGTFRPVQAETLEEHPMHSERFRVGTDALDAISATRARGGRVVAIGTTSCRSLESLEDPLPREAVHRETELMITPGHRFRHVDALLTNFHLPRSTLLALVAALMGLERTMAVYEEAVREGYRFYSYGDAMLIV